jgi:hypothetical protein
LVKFRNDKTQADSYDRIVEQKEAFVHTLEVINVVKTPIQLTQVDG